MSRSAEGRAVLKYELQTTKQTTSLPRDFLLPSLKSPKLQNEDHNPSPGSHPPDDRSRCTSPNWLRESSTHLRCSLPTETNLFQDALQVRKPLPPVWCAWDTDNDGKHKYLVSRPKEGYGSSDLESDDDGTLAKLVGGPPEGRKTP